MRVAALYDIHGNLPALEAVLEEVGNTNADRIVVGGDVVPGPMPRETIERLLDAALPVQFIQGNGEIAVLAEMKGVDCGVPPAFREGIRWNAEQLGPRDRELLASWPGTLRLEIPGLGRLLFCHATPQNPDDVFTRLTPEDRILSLFAHVAADVVACGHTHMQFDRTVGNVRVINAGSVGMPFGKPGAYWVLLASGIEFRRTDYDLKNAAVRIGRTMYPDASQFAANNVLQPPTEEKMLKAFGAD